MSFNVEKSHTICFSAKKANLHATYVLNSHVLTRVHQHSYLDVILSEDLKWSGAKKTLGVIRRNFRNSSVACKSKLYNSLVRPKIEYAISAW